jgi:peptide/nickel transport system permease protein
LLRYLARRVLLGLFTIWFVSVAAFVIIQLPPGDFVTTYIAQLEADGRVGSTDEAAALRTLYGLDRPMVVQYWEWISQVVRGNLGQSLESKRPVADVIGDSLWLTIAVSIASIALTWLIALPIGIYSAVRQYSIGDYVFTFFSFLGLAIPNLLLALVLLYFGFVWFHANIGGLFSRDFIDAPWSLARLWDLLQHLPIPGIVLAIGGTAALTRVMRANLLDELHKPYVVTARAKGLTERQVLLKYPVRVALNPFASGIAFLLPEIVSGSVIVSLVLSLPTVGPILLRSLLAQDMFLAGAIVLLLGTMTVIGILISDLILMWLDPRVRIVS